MEKGFKHSFSPWLPCAAGPSLFQWTPYRRAGRHDQHQRSWRWCAQGDVSASAQWPHTLLSQTHLVGETIKTPLIILATFWHAKLEDVTQNLYTATLNVCICHCSLPCPMEREAKLYICMAMAKSSRLLRNWKKDLNSSKVIPWKIRTKHVWSNKTLTSLESRKVTKKITIQRDVQTAFQEAHQLLYQKKKNSFYLILNN